MTRFFPAMSMRPGGEGWEVYYSQNLLWKEIFGGAYLDQVNHHEFSLLFAHWAPNFWTFEKGFVRTVHAENLKKNKPKRGNHPVSSSIGCKLGGLVSKLCGNSSPTETLPDDESACDRFCSCRWTDCPSEVIPNKFSKQNFSTVPHPWKLIYIYTYICSPPKKKGGPFQKGNESSSSNGPHVKNRTFPGPKGGRIEAWLRWNLEPRKMVGV